MPRRLSRLAGLLVLLLGSAALAEAPPEAANPPESAPESEDAAPAPRPAPARTKVPYRVVKILSDSEQALLFDKHQGRHVLVEVGEEIGDYTVDAIDDDEVTLTGGAAGSEVQIVVLAAPERSRRAGKDRLAKAATAKPTADITSALPAPQDPYGEPVVSETPASDVRSVSAAGFEVEDPYDTTPAAPPAPVAASPDPAPAAPTAAPIPPPATAAAPGPAAPPSTEPSTSPSWDGAPPTTTAPPAPPTTPAPAAAPAGPLMKKLARKDVDAALADFGALASSISAAFTPGGLRLDAVTEGTIFMKAGLLTGDVIVSVDGKPLRSLDDAADLYARASTTKATTLAVLRAGKPVVLRVAIQ